MRQFLRVIIGMIGAAVGVSLAVILTNVGVIEEANKALTFGSLIAGGLVGFLLFFALSEWVISKLSKLYDNVFSSIQTVSLSQIVLRTIGLVVGLIIAGLVSSPVLQLSISRLGNVIGVLIAVVLYIMLGLFGMRTAAFYHDDIMRGLSHLSEALGRNEHGKSAERETKREKIKAEKARSEQMLVHSAPKILDTSVIIDGRVFEVLKTGFLEGPLVISHYVLEELQHISDSADPLKRERGRRGLDQIQELQQQKDIVVEVDNRLIDRSEEVDIKLLLLTKEREGYLVTNDFNLNKVATVQGVRVLNVNALANALRPVVIPGERLDVDIIKEGKEVGQGLGYLEDGTMIVVENGADAIGEHVDTVVTSVLQTAAGKMIFTRIDEEA